MNLTREQFWGLEMVHRNMGNDPSKMIPDYDKFKKLFGDRAANSFSPALVESSIKPLPISASEESHRGTEYWLKKFITADPEMLKLKDSVRKLAKLDDSVLITGETGTGKELIAHALHGNRSGAFVALNCGGFPENLIESELFGHVKGAFTGAWSDKVGLFKAAEGGTLFLDEVAELPLLMQCKLLRAIQEKCIRRVGDVEDMRVNCRIVSATHQKIDDGPSFRQDLYWRISTFELRISPLRDRSIDAELIATSLGKNLNGLDHEALGRLEGNVRELQRYIRRKQEGI